MNRQILFFNKSLNHKGFSFDVFKRDLTHLHTFPLPPNKFGADEHPWEWMKSLHRERVSREWLDPSISGIWLCQGSDPPHSSLHVQSHFGSSSGKFSTGRVCSHTKAICRTCYWTLNLDLGSIPRWPVKGVFLVLK